MLSPVRTTVTLDPDTERLVRRLMERRGVSFKQALNDAIRAGAAPGSDDPSATTPRHLGIPMVALDRALQLSGELEDEEIVRELRTGR